MEFLGEWSILNHVNNYIKQLKEKNFLKDKRIETFMKD